MTIGNIKFDEFPLFLAPMEDVTDASFRYICKAFGADMMYTEFISSDGLIRDAKKALAKMVTYPYEKPIGIQIYGHIPEAMEQAAEMAENASAIAGGCGADLIDINFGCPVNKIAGRGAGSGMMREPDKMVEITGRIVKRCKLPVTVKTRLGWDENSRIIVELPRMHIPVIGNGDITDGPSAKTAFDRYGIDAVMIGRATYGRPWIFKEIKYYLEHGTPMPPLTVSEKVELAKKHLAKSLECKGERVGVLEMRRHLSNYFKGIDNFKETRLKLVTENSPEKVFELLDYIKANFE